MLFRTLLFHLCSYPWTILLILLGAPFSFISPNYLHNFGIIWARGCLLFAGIRVRVTGTENIPGERSAVYIANHQSHFDILAMYASLPVQFRWMAKKELFDIPLFGMAMRRSGYISIDRSDHRKSLHSMIEAAQKVKDGTSVIIFPEGTRTYDGKVQPFKKGGFMIAQKAGVPLVPVVITGSFGLLPRGTLRVRPGVINVEILPGVETGHLTSKDLDTLMNELHDTIATRVEEKNG